MGFDFIYAPSTFDLYFCPVHLYAVTCQILAVNCAFNVQESNSKIYKLRKLHIYKSRTVEDLQKAKFTQSMQILF